MFGISKLADEYSITTYFGFNVVRMYMLPLANNNMFDSPCFSLVVFSMHSFIPIYVTSPTVQKFCQYLFYDNNLKYDMYIVNSMSIIVTLGNKVDTLFILWLWLPLN